MIASEGIVDLSRQWLERLVHDLNKIIIIFSLWRFFIAICSRFSFMFWLR